MAGWAPAKAENPPPLPKALVPEEEPKEAKAPVAGLIMEDDGVCPKADGWPNAEVGCAIGFPNAEIEPVAGGCEKAD